MLPGDANRGKEVFQTKGCLHCHAIRGEGGKLGPDFAVVKLKNNVTEIAGIMWNHGPKMWELMQKENLPLPKFTSLEMADVIAYLFFISFNSCSGDPADGQKVFVNKGCNECHSINGKGGKIAADLSELKEIISPLSMAQIMWNHAPHMIEKMKEKKVSWPKFKENDVPNLYAYLQLISKKAKNGL